MRANRAAGARAILDHYRLAKRGTQLVRYRARDDVTGATRSLGDNQLDGTVRVGLAPSRCHYDGSIDHSGDKSGS